MNTNCPIKFATDNCPICGTKLESSSSMSRASFRLSFICPTARSEQRIENNQREDNDPTPPTAHVYEVFQSFNDNWIQNVDVPPFGIDSDCVIKDGVQEYSTTLYIWTDKLKKTNDPGWEEIGTYAYIPIGKKEIIIERIKRLLPFV